jgi:hypothetical protein
MGLYFFFSFFLSNLLGEKWEKHFGVDPNLSSATK